LRHINNTEKEEVKAVQRKIDKLNLQTKIEENIAEEAAVQKAVAEKQLAMKNAKTAEEWTTAYSELKDIETEYARKKTLEQRQLQLEAWREEIESIRGNAQEKRDKAEEDLEANKNDLDKKLENLKKYFVSEKEAIDKHHEQLISDENLFNETKKIMADETQGIMIKTLEKYYPDWHTARKTFGQRLL
jgi:hypothetical protein